MLLGGRERSKSNLLNLLEDGYMMSMYSLVKPKINYV